MVLSSTIEVTATVNGVTFTDTKLVTVQSRGWVDDYPQPPITDAGQGTLPSNPTQKEHLGETVSPGQNQFQAPNLSNNSNVEIVISGPNIGWLFITEVPVGAWDMEAHISPALTDSNHPFYISRTNINGPDYMAKLNERVRIHEGVLTDPNYTSHVAQGLAQITATPLNPWAESHVQHYASINPQNWQQAAQVFANQVENVLSNRRTAVANAIKPHPANKYPNLPNPFP